MRRVALALIVALFAVPAGTTSASAAPIDVDAEPVEGGGVTVTATVPFLSPEPIQTMTAGRTVTGDDGKPGLCARGIHTSCTPADEASEASGE